MFWIERSRKDGKKIIERDLDLKYQLGMSL